MMTGVMTSMGQTSAQATSSSTRVCNTYIPTTWSGQRQGIPGRFIYIPFRDKSITGCLLSEGDGLSANTGSGTKNAVKVLQNAMNTCYASTVKKYNGGYLLSVDGKFGGKTRDVLKAVQTVSHVKNDGILGPNTLIMMEWASNAFSGGSCYLVDGAALH